MAFCNYCDRVVEGKREFSWLMFVLWLIFTIPILPIFGTIPYLLYWALIKPKTCPICKMGV